MDNMLVLLPKDEKPGFFFFGLFMDCLHAKIRSHLLTESIADPSWMATRVDELWTVPGRCSQDVVSSLNNSDNTGFYTPSPSTTTTNGSRCIFLQDVPSPTVLPQGWDSLPVIRLICDLHSLSGSMLLCDTSTGIHCPIVPGKMRRSYFSSRQVCFSKTGFKNFFFGRSLEGNLFIVSSLSRLPSEQGSNPFQISHSTNTGSWMKIFTYSHRSGWTSFSILWIYFPIYHHS